uniref:Uncharacterized protein n=1 Tax=Salix viminalis TaxID=40686 RepID=A0A6N2KB41_SALVM
MTKFVLAKALKYGIRPILLLNKSLVFDLFANLGATEEQLDFPVLYASAKEGWASSSFTKDPPTDMKNMSQLLDAIIRHVMTALPTVELDPPTISMTFGVNDSPLAGRDGTHNMRREGFEL